MNNLLLCCQYGRIIVLSTFVHGCFVNYRTLFCKFPYSYFNPDVMHVHASSQPCQNHVEMHAQLQGHDTTLLNYTCLSLQPCLNPFIMHVCLHIHVTILWYIYTAMLQPCHSSLPVLTRVILQPCYNPATTSLQPCKWINWPVNRILLGSCRASTGKTFF